MGSIQQSLFPSLDPNCQTSTWKNKRLWSKKQKRAYSRILSGVKRCLYRSERVFFLTLTSGIKRGFKELAVDWDLFVKRIRRDFSFSFPFFKVTTLEGNGVIHALFVAKKGEFELNNGWSYDAIHAYFSTLWQELHGAYVVWCRVCYTVHGKFNRLCAYVVNQYVAGQSFCHMGYSSLWCFKGFNKKFLGLVHSLGFVRAVRLWDFILKSFDPLKINDVQFPIGF